MQKLMTKAGENLTGIPHDRYPRPQLKRDDWINLNGKWDLTINEKETEILVPFAPESLLSGVEEEVKYGEELIYKRKFKIPNKWEGKRIILHFGAVSRHAVIFINGKKIGEHKNSYLPFSFDITNFIKIGENTLKVKVINDVSELYPYGKQKIDRGGMWYTPVSGIWQTVWLEAVPEEYIKKLDINTTLDTVEILAEGVDEGTVIIEDKEYPLIDGRAKIKISEPKLWSPEEPNLYEFTIKNKEDEVQSYFALRTLETKELNGKPRLFLNGRPYFFNGVLDQGYWSDGLYTPPTLESFEEDILAMKELGFNTLRKHIKIEPEQFYYDADRLGMIVFQDMVNNGKYSYIRDTVFPTIGILKRDDKNLQKNEEVRTNFYDSMEETVKHLKNHPSIALWTIFNEGWGQFSADEAYKFLKNIDDTRFIDTTSGWFHQKDSDVDSLHIYFKKLHLGKENKPQFISEFGGYSYKIPAHSFNLDNTYAYKNFDNREEFVKGLRQLYLNELLPLVEEGLSGAIYTQVSDVEDETNGFLTYDRKRNKVKPEELKDISEKINLILKLLEEKENKNK